MIQLIETWKDIKDYEGLYQVSNLGRVKSLKRNKETILKPIPHYIGYYQVSLSGKFHYIHRLVATAFIDKNKDDLFKIYVNHLNGNKNDNRWFNLEWCTHSENIKHSYKDLGRKPCEWITTNAMHKKKVLQFDLENNILNQWDSLTEAAEYLNGSKKNISECLNKRSKTAYGFKWQYL